MEVRPAENWALLERAQGRGVRTVLNVAPAAPVPAEALEALVRGWSVNQHEAAGRGAPSGADVRRRGGGTARALAARAGLTCVRSPWAATAPWRSPTGALWRVAALAVEPVDPYRRRGPFTGVFAAGLDAGLGLGETLRRASVAAAARLRGWGAQDSMPRAADIERRASTGCRCLRRGAA